MPKLTATTASGPSTPSPSPLTTPSKSTGSSPPVAQKDGLIRLLLQNAGSPNHPAAAAVGAPCSKSAPTTPSPASALMGPPKTAPPLPSSVSAAPSVVGSPKAAPPPPTTSNAPPLPTVTITDENPVRFIHQISKVVSFYIGELLHSGATSYLPYSLTNNKMSIYRSVSAARPDLTTTTSGP